MHPPDASPLTPSLAGLGATGIRIDAHVPARRRAPKRPPGEIPAGAGRAYSGTSQSPTNSVRKIRGSPLTKWKTVRMSVAGGRGGSI
jgi:hypothetical protein